MRLFLDPILSYRLNKSEKPVAFRSGSGRDRWVAFVLVNVRNVCLCEGTNEVDS